MSFFTRIKKQEVKPKGFAHIFKFNPYHDEKGRFTHASRSTGGGGLESGVSSGPIAEGGSKPLIKRRLEASRELESVVSSKFHDEIPVSDIVATMAKHGLKPVRDERSNLTRLLDQDEGQAKLDIYDTITEKSAGKQLIIEWFKHQLVSSFNPNLRKTQIEMRASIA